ncbi:MAG: CHAT domain-containing protein [Rhodothermales bacterium]|nr:CHAT domain-containing protein [Rhodothermales bacterium]
MHKGAITYQDFTLKIGPMKGQEYAVTLQDSASGTSVGDLWFNMASFAPTDAPVDAPAPPDTATGAPTRGERERKPKTAISGDELGLKLFRELIKEGARDAFMKSLGATQLQPDIALRVKLVLDLKMSGMDKIVGLPWELLFDDSQNSFLNLLPRDFSVVRYLNIARPKTAATIEALPYDGPLRMLLVMANPDDPVLPKLNLEVEKKKILERFGGDASPLQVEILEHATTEKLMAKLEEGPDFHVLHFMGHGVFKDDGEGVLVMEDDAGKRDDLSANNLYYFILSKAHSIRLVFLNACETANNRVANERHPFAGVAPAIVSAGVPAVIAMQKPISDPGAIAFAETFYAALADGAPVDYAVNEGRLDMFNKEPGTLEWATPVLFMQAPDGVLFKPKRAKAPEPEPAPAPATNGATRSVYILCKPGDKEFLMPVFKYLRVSGFSVDKSPFEGDEAAILAADREALATADAVLILWGNGGDAWRRERNANIKEALKTRPPLRANYLYICGTPDEDKQFLIDLEEQAFINGLQGFSDALMADFVDKLNS